jgi:hypothetical protein
VTSELHASGATAFRRGFWIAHGMALDRTLSKSSVTHPMNVPVEQVDIADWLFNLSDAEYQRMAPTHIAAAISRTDDGRPMSINVETIGSSLVVQHYVIEVREPHLCRLVSTSDTFMAGGRTKVQVIWELSAHRIDDRSSKYTNSIHAAATDEFLAFLEKTGTSLESARKARQQGSDAHNHVETPNYARSIEKWALQRAGK